MSAIKKRGRWYFRKRIPGLGRIFIAPGKFGLSNTKVGAEEAGRRHIAKLRGESKTPIADAPTLADFQSVFIEHSEAKNEYSSVKAKRQILRDHLVPAFGPMPLNAITFARIEDFKNRLTRGEDGLSGKTGNNILTVLRRLLILAHKRGLIVSVPQI